jgi:hypothetical protein
MSSQEGNSTHMQIRRDPSFQDNLLPVYLQVLILHLQVVLRLRLRGLTLATRSKYLHFSPFSFCFSSSWTERLNLHHYLFRDNHDLTTPLILTLQSNLEISTIPFSNFYKKKLLIIVTSSQAQI